jgi:hypothetical protein
LVIHGNGEEKDFADAGCEAGFEEEGNRARIRTEAARAGT